MTLNLWCVADQSACGYAVDPGKYASGRRERERCAMEAPDYPPVWGRNGAVSVQAAPPSLVNLGSTS